MELQAVANNEIAILISVVGVAARRSCCNPLPPARGSLPRRRARHPRHPTRRNATQEDVRAHHRPRREHRDRRRQVRADLALVARRGETSGDTGRGRFIMLTIGRRLDEFGLVDDAVDVAVIAGELEEGRKCAALAIQRRPPRPSTPGRHCRALAADMSRTSAWNSASFEFEVGVEGTERDAGALGDADDRAFGKAALAKFLARGIEDLAQSSVRHARCAALCSAGGAELRVFFTLSPIRLPLTPPCCIHKLKHGSCFIMA